MPLIERQPKEKKETLSVAVDVEVLQDLDFYCEFLESNKGFVVQNVLKYVLDKDKEFQKWKESPAGKLSAAVNGKANGLAKQ